MSKFSVVIRHWEVLNQISLLAYVALTVFTPLYPMQKMILLLGFFGLWFITAIQLDEDFLSNVSLLLVLLAAILTMGIFSSVASGSVDGFLNVINEIPNLSWAIVGIFYMSNTELLQKTKWIIIGLILISALFTLVGNIEYPGASRTLANVLDQDAAARALYRSKNIGGYGFIYALVFLLFPIVSLARYNSKRAVYIICAVLFSITVLISSYMTAIIFSVAIIIIALIKEKNTVRTIFIVGAVFAVIYIFRENILSWFVSFGRAIDSDILVKRAQELLTGEYIGSAGDEDNRLTLFANAVKNWLDSPFTGRMFGATLEYRRSGHSEILGYLEKWGLFAAVYFGFFKIAYSKIARGFETWAMSKSYLIFYVLFLMFITVDIFGSFDEIGCIVLFFAPVMMKMCEDRIDEEYNEEDGELDASAGEDDEDTLAYE